MVGGSEFLLDIMVKNKIESKLSDNCATIYLKKLMQSKMKTAIMHWLPRCVVILSILFVSIFAFDTFSSNINIWQQLIEFFIHLIPSYILLIALIIAWKFELIGGVIFILISLGFAPFIFNHNYHMNHSISISLGIIMMINFPFFLAGILFLLDHQNKKKNNIKDNVK